jgi:hypothetical protein
MISTGLFYGLSTPIGVHIGYLMAKNNWLWVFIESAALVTLHIFAPLLWIKAQTYDIQKTEQKKGAGKSIEKNHKK